MANVIGSSMLYWNIPQLTRHVYCNVQLQNNHYFVSEQALNDSVNNEKENLSTSEGHFPISLFVGVYVALDYVLSLF
jgi:hypothetical protein